MTILQQLAKDVLTSDGAARWWYLACNSPTYMGGFAADSLLRKRTDLLQRWQEGVRAAIPAARDQPEAILLVSMPAILDDLMDILRLGESPGLVHEGELYARAHGEQRAHLSGFGMRELV